MANLLWTGILYFSTLSIVFITYRTFVNDRKMENDRKMQDVVARAQKIRGKDPMAMEPRPARKQVAAGQRA